MSSSFLNIPVTASMEPLILQTGSIVYRPESGEQYAYRHLTVTRTLPALPFLEPIAAFDTHKPEPWQSLVHDWIRDHRAHCPKLHIVGTYHVSDQAHEDVVHDTVFKPDPIFWRQAVSWAKLTRMIFGPEGQDYECFSLNLCVPHCFTAIARPALPQELADPSAYTYDHAEYVVVEVHSTQPYWPGKFHFHPSMAQDEPNVPYLLMDILSRALPEF